MFQRHAKFNWPRAFSWLWLDVPPPQPVLPKLLSKRCPAKVPKRKFPSESSQATVPKHTIPHRSYKRETPIHVNNRSSDHAGVVCWQDCCCVHQLQKWKDAPRRAGTQMKNGRPILTASHDHVKIETKTRPTSFWLGTINPARNDSYGGCLLSGTRWTLPSSVFSICLS